MCNCCEQCKSYKSKYKLVNKELREIKRKCKLFIKKWINKKN